MTSPITERRELPVGWLLTSIGEIAETIRGVTYKKEDSSLEAKSGLIPILRATNIGNGLDFEELVYVPPDNVSAAQFLRLNDIVIAASSGSRAIVGKAAMLSSEWRGSFGAFCYALRPNPLINARLLAYFLQTSEYRNQVSNMSAGVNINNLRREHIESIPYRVAPNDEQARIVEKIDEQFTRLDAAVVALKRIQANLKRYRAAVLKAACEGRLVPTEAELARREGRSYEPASVLLERILAERRSRWEEQQRRELAVGDQKQPSNWKSKYPEPATLNSNDLPMLPMGWCWATLEQVVSMFVDSAHRTPKYSPTGIPALGPRDIVNGHLDLESARTIDEAEFTIQTVRRIPQPGDIIYSRELSYGWAVAVPSDARLCLSQGMCLFRAHDAVSTYYVLHFLNGPEGRRQASIVATGSAHPHINLGDIKAFHIPLPSTTEQHRIVEVLEDFLSVIEHLETEVENKLKSSQSLRQALLKRAFEGKLVKQDPNDEPANVLLEQIRAGRNTVDKSLPTVPRIRRKKEAAHVS